MQMYSLRRTKLFISLLLLLLCANGVLGSTTVAYADESKTPIFKSHVYTLDNQVIEYYLDNNNMPYVIRDGVQVPIALPLEHLLVTDEEVLSNLIEKNNRATYARSSAPTSYFDMRNGGTYTQTMYLSNSYSNTSYIRINQSHPVIRIRTSNEVKNSFFTGKKISYVVYYYFEATDSWYSYTVNDCNVSNDNGGALDIGRGIYSYVYYGVKKSSDLSQVNVYIWQSDV